MSKGVTKLAVMGVALAFSPCGPAQGSPPGRGPEPGHQLAVYDDTPSPVGTDEPGDLIACSEMRFVPRLAIPPLKFEIPPLQTDGKLSACCLVEALQPPGAGDYLTSGSSLHLVHLATHGYPGSTEAVERLTPGRVLRLVNKPDSSDLVVVYPFHACPGDWPRVHLRLPVVGPKARSAEVTQEEFLALLRGVELESRGRYQEPRTTTYERLVASPLEGKWSKPLLQVRVGDDTGRSKKPGGGSGRNM